ncbi:hypothetical protein Cs7R123_29780 [Catellatospora sp. TT07R-123]|uniref:hypothetical protein n=1 Tax=Catellatospora sp. TT07R-123 TaxID=2733863 RepID=UPI001B26E2B9|nr:hypothetical protein [Catellatospora sp. TT07R-123]GHJ45636.1 hypothetical protein Cs7R123_29780 [Catellatospora sp. TT07R-123]
MVSTDTASEVQAAPSGPEPVRPITSYRTDLVMVVLGLWFTVGLMLDAWAHNNVPGLETFFTPWHAVFYWGFLVTGGWIAWTVRPALRGGGLPNWRAMPVGYASASVAVLAFAVFGFGDFTWHEVFGIEQNIDILFSPTHLGLVVSMFVIVTTPLRAAWLQDRPVATGLRPLLPAILSLALGSILILLFLQYGNVITFGAGSVQVALSNPDEGFTGRFVTMLALTTVVLLAPLLLIAKRWTVPVGTATILYGFLGLLSTAVTGFNNVEMVAGLVVGGIGVDLLAWWLRPSAAAPRRLRVFAALAAGWTWIAFFGAAYAAGGSINWVGKGDPVPTPELLTGIPVVAALVGLLLAVLVAPTMPAGRAAE